jgi:hypothetical protein
LLHDRLDERDSSFEFEQSSKDTHVRKLLLLSAMALIIPVASEAAPISVDCPGTPGTTDREFTLTTDPAGATCLNYGNGANELNANGFDVMVLAGWTVIDKDEAFSADNWFTITGLGANSGTFSIDPAAWAAWGDIAIGFVVGGGRIDPKWAVFSLPQGETSGFWSDAPPQGGNLSHAILYGKGDPGGRDITAVPEPATLLLLGSGLTIAARRRMRGKR